MINATMEKLAMLKLSGMARALEEQLRMPEMTTMAFEQRLAMLVDREEIERTNRRSVSRLRAAKLKWPQACLEDVNWRNSRGLDKAAVMTLASGEWIPRHQNVIITGPTGVGKSYLACALGQRACLNGMTVKYARVPRLFGELNLARAAGNYLRVVKDLEKTDVLILDDWLLNPLSEAERKDFLEIVEDRYDARSSIITTQYPVETWPERIGDPTIADAIMDRMIHNAHHISPRGPSQRKERSSTGKGANTN